MKDISNLKKHLENVYAKALNKQPSDREVEILAEVNALWQTVIPDPYYKYSINHFNGHSDDNTLKLLTKDVALTAKKKFVEYCWGKDFDLNDDVHDALIMTQKSIMDRRFREGKNVIIYAPTSKESLPPNLLENKMGHLRNQRGRTMIAALIMKEAIRLRYSPGHRMHGYDWIEYPVLKSMLTEDKASLNMQRAADWLVVDDINLESSSPAAMSYISSVVDPFFISRVRDGLPTIFVFRFDVNKEILNIEKSLGVAVHRIVNDPKTHVISLGD